MHEQKYRYFIDGKEVDNRTDYLNTTMSGDYVSYFDGDSVFSVSFSDFFGGQKEKQIEQRLKLAEYYKEKAIKEYELDTPLTKASRGLNDHVKDILDLGQIKGNSTRHKSQNGETHTKTCIETIKEKQDKYYPFLRVNFQVGENGSEGCKVYTNFHTINEVKEYMKDTDYTHYFVYDINGKKISWGSVNKDSKNNQIFAEKTEKKKDLVFQKDSEIHKEELKPDFSFTGTPKEINEGVNEGVKRNNEGVKESQTTEKAPVFTYCKVNKNALEALSLRALYGHKKYEEENDWENFSRVPNGDFEYSNAMFRHALEIGGEEDEKEHLISSAWNAISRLEIYLRKNQK